MIKPTPEQLAAAERETKVKEAITLLGDAFKAERFAYRYQNTHPLVCVRSLCILADAYLSHIDASRDDGVVVDEAWLRSIGFVDFKDSMYAVAIKMPSTTTCTNWLVCSDSPNAEECPWEVWNIHPGRRGLIEKSLICEFITTRGQLRRLLEALNINISAGA